MPASSELSLITDDIVFAESPSWHNGELWFSDVHDYKLKRVTVDGDVSVVAELPGRPSGSGFHPNGQLLIGTALDGQLLWVTASGSVSAAFDASGQLDGLINDMVVDGQGRAYFGDTGFRPDRGEAPKAGRIMLYDEHSGLRPVADNIEFPNGCAVSADGKTLYYAESFGERVISFNIGPDGDLSQRNQLIALGEAPDGLCLDAHGCLWIGLPHSGRFVRVTQEGQVIDEISSPAPFAVTCVIGGPERRTLFMCSADTDLQRLARGESRGRIDALELAYSGAGWP